MHVWQKCIVLRDCSYTYVFCDINKEMVEISNQVEIHKVEIRELKNQNHYKKNVLAKVHFKELECVQNKKNLLKKAMKKGMIT